MLYTSKSDFVRRSNVICETSHYKVMNCILRNDERKILMLNTSKSGFVRQNAVDEGGKKQDLNHGPQYPQSTLESLRLSTMLGPQFFTII